MKKIICLFIVSILMFNLVGCGKKKSVGENENNFINDEDNNYEYYSFLTKDGEGLKFNMTADEFLNKFNRYMSTNDINSNVYFSNFSYQDSTTNYNGTVTDLYLYPISHNGINMYIGLGKENKGNKLTGISLSVVNMESHLNNPNAAATIMANYFFLVESLGVPRNDSDKMYKELLENVNNTGKYCTYYKGLLLMESDSNFNIFPYTAEQYKEIDDYLNVLENDRAANVKSSSNEGIKFYDYKNSELLNQNDIVSAEAVSVSMSTEGDKRWYVRIYFNEDGRKKFTSATDGILKYSKENRYISIKINGDIIACPAINQKSEDDNVIIMGNFDEDSATALAKKIEDVINEDKNNNEIKYRVRKSANDPTTQIGAFRDLNNAKNTADKYKNDGYKVYDMNGNIVYIP